GASRGEPGESVLVEIDEDRDTPFASGLGNGSQLLHITVVVHPGRRLISLPEEQQADYVEAQGAEKVEVAGAGARRKRRQLGIARDIHAAEDHHATLRIDKMAPGYPEQGGVARPIDSRWE